MAVRVAQRATTAQIQATHLQRERFALQATTAPLDLQVRPHAKPVSTTPSQGRFRRTIVLVRVWAGSGARRASTGRRSSMITLLDKTKAGKDGIVSCTYLREVFEDKRR